MCLAPDQSFRERQMPLAAEDMRRFGDRRARVLAEPGDAILADPHYRQPFCGCGRCGAFTR